MEGRNEDNSSEELLNTVFDDIKADSQDKLKEKLLDCEPAETANLLESMPPTERFSELFRIG